MAKNDQEAEKDTYVEGENGSLVKEMGGGDERGGNKKGVLFGAFKADPRAARYHIIWQYKRAHQNQSEPRSSHATAWSGHPAVRSPRANPRFL